MPQPGVTRPFVHMAILDTQALMGFHRAGARCGDRRPPVGSVAARGAATDSTWKRPLDAPASTVIGVPGKGERRGSQGACAPWDGANGPSLWLGCALQG